MDINEKINSEAAAKMRAAIEAADGNEVFFRGIPDEEGVVADVEVLARGNINSVPAIVSRMKLREVIIHNHPSGYLYPSDNDVAIASYYGNSGGGSYIINNSVTELYIIVEIHKEQSETVDVSEYFCENGKISIAFPEFEYRKEQEDMAHTVEHCLNEGKKGIIEAGTGTGKTLAYLIPSILYGKRNGIKTIISTNTINLQEQLMRKDIPLVEKITGEDFKYVLVKGRSNYVCIRKLNHIDNIDIEEFSDSQKRELESVINWAGRSVEGDKQELNFEVSYPVWEKAASESDLCLKNKCPYKERCFFHKARKRTAGADLLIINHHVYFADLAIRKETGFVTEYSILPNYNIAIFDEAHNIEGVARDYFSQDISRYSFNKIMNNIYSIKGERTQNSGAAPKVLKYLSTINYSKSSLKNLNDIFNMDIILEHRNLYEKVNEFFTKFSLLFSTEEDKGEIKVRFKPEEVKNDERWQEELFPRIRAIKESYIGYFKILSKFENLIEIEEEEDESGIISDLFRYIDRIKMFFDEFYFIFKVESSDHVYWSEINLKRGNVRISATPLEIKQELREALYQNLDRILFTSATLSIGDSFKYFKKSIGLEEESVEKKIDSPFDYEKCMEILIPNDIEDPSSRTFGESVTGFMLDLIRKTKGNTFILFTSYSNLNYFYYSLREDLTKEGFNIMLQGEMPRHRMLDIYKKSKRPVLFGTDSFWEGVDVKGEKLSSVIIVKLPFRVPSDPVVEAVIEKIESEGRSSFMEYQVPEAVIKFKQGAGRLIRSKDDKGIITILDIRVLKKHYGRIFLKSLPNGKKIIGGKEEILKKITVFAQE